MDDDSLFSTCLQPPMTILEAEHGHGLHPQCFCCRGARKPVVVTKNIQLLVQQQVRIEATTYSIGQQFCGTHSSNLPFAHVPHHLSLSFPPSFEAYRQPLVVVLQGGEAVVTAAGSEHGLRDVGVS